MLTHEVFVTAPTWATGEAATAAVVEDTKGGGADTKVVLEAWVVEGGREYKGWDAGPWADDDSSSTSTGAGAVDAEAVVWADLVLGDDDVWSWSVGTDLLSVEGNEGTNLGGVDTEEQGFGGVGDEEFVVKGPDTWDFSGGALDGSGKQDVTGGDLGPSTICWRAEMGAEPE